MDSCTATKDTSAETTREKEVQKLVDDASQLITQNKLKEAAGILARAVESSPRSIELRMLTALVHAQIGDPKCAEEQLRAVLRMKPDNADALHNLAVLLTSTGQYEHAKKCLHKLLVLDEKNVDVYNDLAVIEAESGNIAGAEQAYTQGMRLQSSNKKIYHNYLEFCNTTGNNAAFDIAASHYRKRWHVDPPISWNN